MKLIIISALVASQILAASPAGAASIQDHQELSQRSMGAFAGARLRMPLGRNPQRPHLGFAIASTRRDGPTGAMRFSPGMEMGFTGDGKARFFVGGESWTLAPQSGERSKGPKAGVSTLGWVAIGVAATALVGAGLFYAALTDCDDHDDEC